MCRKLSQEPFLLVMVVILPERQLTDRKDIPFTLLFYTLLGWKPAWVTIDISGRQFLAMKNLVDNYDFPPLSYISVLEKKTDLRVLILFWFSFSGLQVRIPASCP